MNNNIHFVVTPGMEAVIAGAIGVVVLAVIVILVLKRHGTNVIKQINKSVQTGVNHLEVQGQLTLQSLDAKKKEVETTFKNAANDAVTKFNDAAKSVHADFTSTATDLKNTLSASKAHLEEVKSTVANAGKAAGEIVTTTAQSTGNDIHDALNKGAKALHDGVEQFVSDVKDAAGLQKK